MIPYICECKQEDQSEREEGYTVKECQWQLRTSSGREYHSKEGYKKNFKIRTN